MIGARAGVVLVGLLLSLAAVPHANAEPSEKSLEVVPGSFRITPSTTQASAHENLTTTFDVAHESTSTAPTYNDLRGVEVELPPGFVGSNTAVPTCDTTQLLAFTGAHNGIAECPVASQVGTISFEVSNVGPNKPPMQFEVPLYNMETTSFGIAAEFGFKTVIFTQTLIVKMRPGDSGLTIITPNINRSEVRNVSATVWGLPASEEHDDERAVVCGGDLEPAPANCSHELGSSVPVHVQVKPYLSNPTSCGTFAARMRADSWEHPEEWSEAETEVGPITECERVPFTPEIKATATTDAAESSTGLDFAMDVPQAWDNPFTISTANLKDATVSLPEGMSLN
ncbi:MAG: hypothetical protein ACTHN3_14310, partial [Solirubrobacterales bacterium]